MGRGPPFRGRCITQLREALQRHADELREILVSEVGCPIFMTRSPMIQLDVPLIYLEDSAEQARSYNFETYMADLERPYGIDRRLIIKEPWGVAGIITPYNYPIQQLCAKVGPALAAGNTVVLKPSPFTPWSACFVGKIAAEETDIPPGVLNVLTTTSAEVSEAIVAHPGVDMISFTGSTAVGRRIMETAAKQVKKLFLELGGKSASIVLDDADIEEVVTGGVFRMSRHSGQGCVNLTRMLLPRAHYEAALEVAAAAAAKVPWGDPRDENTHMGPQVGKPQQQRVLGYIEKGLAEGGRLIAGGGVPSGTTGYFVEATVIADVKPDDTIAQQEIFGPVLAVMPYDTEEEAIAIANNSIYGLSGRGVELVDRTGLAGRPAGPHRHARLQRRLVVGPRHALRRDEAERPRPGERHHRLRGVPRHPGDLPPGVTPVGPMPAAALLTGHPKMCGT